MLLRSYWNVSSVLQHRSDTVRTFCVGWEASSSDAILLCAKR
uniref:Uncharacterized protein n=1 Tax=Anguilla anguilla TaxID=7936 RepID=A0A0E9TCZ1_ANGAN